MRPVVFPDDSQFWFETLRVLGHAAYGGSDFGEVLATVERIDSGDYDGWYDAWLATAHRLAAEANRAKASGHSVSARDAFMRASTYYRTAEFFLHGDPTDPRIDHAYDRSVACFHEAASRFEPVIEPVEIPYEGTTLHGYLYRAGDAGQSRPTMLMHNGFDGATEEMHFFGAAAGVERGYNVLTFDGPGQPSAIHGKKLVLRPDWENVVGPILDWMIEQPGVDEDRIGLLGISLGGMLAPRAAAFERRLAAVVAVDGVYDASTPLTEPLPLDLDEITRRANAAHDEEFDALLVDAIDRSPLLRWAFGHGQYVTGTSSPRAFLASYLRFNLFDGVAERITCPTLVCAAENDLFFAGDGANRPQADLLYEHLACPKTLLRFTGEEGADAHCHVGAQRLAMARIYDWLDRTLVE